VDESDARLLVALKGESSEAANSAKPPRDDQALGNVIVAIWQRMKQNNAGGNVVLGLSKERRLSERLVGLVGMYIHVFTLLGLEAKIHTSYIH